VASGLSGYLARHERILLIAGGLLLINANLMTDIIGAMIVVGMFFLQKVQNRNRSNAVPA